MTVSRREYPHHTREQVTGCLDDALSILNELGVEGKLAEVALPKLMELLSAKQIEIVADAHPLAGIGLAPRVQ